MKAASNVFGNAIVMSAAVGVPAMAAISLKHRASAMWPIFSGGASGLIRQLRSDGQSLSCQFEGTVRELSVGEGDRRQILMPTWLEWIRQRDALLQFWAVAGYLTALGLAISRWWTEPK